MVAIRQDMPQDILLPPTLVHGLRERSSRRLVQMASAPGKLGFGRKLFRSIVPVVSRQKTPIEKAVTMAYLCSYFADHIVLAEAEATRIMDHRELTPEEQKDAWEQHYHAVVLRLAPEVKDADNLLAMMQKLDAYTSLPMSMHRARGRHWRAIERILAPPRGHRNFTHDPEAFLRNKVFEVVGSRRASRAKARMICLAASLLADIDAWKTGTSWHGCYARVMIDLYAVLVDHPRVLNRLVNLT